MKKLLIPAIIAGSIFAYDLNLTTGWQMVGALEDIDINSLNSPNVVSVWSYDADTKKWKAYIPNNTIDLYQYNIDPLYKIKKGEGFWVNSLTTATIYTKESMLYFDYIIDGVSDFTLADVANKTFKVATEDELSEITFDANGKSSIKFPWTTYDLWYENGSIYAKRRDFNDTLRFKKVAADDDGIIVAGVNENYADNGFFDFWMLGELNPVDMSTVLPYTTYDTWGSSYQVYDTNGSVEYYYYDSVSKEYRKSSESNFTVSNGKILVDSYDGNYTWNYLDNNITTYSKEKQYIQIVKKIGRYDVLLNEWAWSSYYVDPNLKNKTWQDAVGEDIVIDGWAILEDNGSVSHYSYTDENNTIVKNTYNYDDENISYQINGDNLIIIRQYNNYEYNETFTLDSSTGKVTMNDNSFDLQVTSSTPIIKEDIMNTYYRPLAKTTNKTPHQKFLERKLSHWR